MTSDKIKRSSYGTKRLPRLNVCISMDEKHRITSRRIFAPLNNGAGERAMLNSAALSDTLPAFWAIRNNNRVRYAKDQIPWLRIFFFFRLVKCRGTVDKANDDFYSTTVEVL